MNQDEGKRQNCTDLGNTGHGQLSELAIEKESDSLAVHCLKKE